jgi:asparagine synthase (glutamine-hydrolysing)
MCGICGIWRPAGPPTIDAMVGALEHRGPDDRGSFVDASVALGMARLAILDTSMAGHQPMSSDDGRIVLVYNGEVYNFQEERRALEAQGVRFASTSDTEVVLRLYERYGDDFLLRLRGMFALAIYDRRGGSGNERLLLARDHFGIKPLLVARRGDSVIFASELRSLLASDRVEPAIDPNAIRQLLLYGAIVQPNTAIRGVTMLLPAHRMIIDRSGERVERYWRMETDRVAGLRSLPYEEQVERLRDALEESVRLQMVSDVPLGAFLSGGVDSALMVAMMTRASGRTLRTFSIGFEREGADIDESEDARRVAEYIGTEHTAVQIRGADVLDRIDHIASSLDQPSVDAVNSYFVSMAARSSVTVAISGTGGDEFFAGYPWYIELVRHQARVMEQSSRSRWPREIAGELLRMPWTNGLMGTRFGPRLLKLRQYGSFLNALAGRRAVFPTHTVARLLAPAIRAEAHAGSSTHSDIAPLDELPNGTTLERVAALTVRGYLNNQLLRDIDVMSMAHSLEVRVPFIDPVVADVAFSLPDSAKLGRVEHAEYTYASTYRQTGAKRILLDIGTQLLPPDYDKQPKRGFAMPFDAWLRGPLADVMNDALSARSVTERGLFDPDEVDAVRRAFLDGRCSWTQPWLLMMTELWCRQVIDRERLRINAARVASAVSVGGAS